jgi:hypothetical protein
VERSGRLGDPANTPWERLFWRSPVIYGLDMALKRPHYSTILYLIRRIWRAPANAKL